MTGGLGLAATVGGSTTTYAAGEAAFGLEVAEYRLRPANWPHGRHLSIAAIADLHAGGPNMGLARIRAVVARTNALHADLVVLLGDYFAKHPCVTEVVPHAAWAAELAQIEAPLGVFAVLGNHDWWHDHRGVVDALHAVDLPILENDVVHLGAQGERFWLAGLGDQIAFRFSPGEYRGVDDLPGTMAKIRTDDPVILLAHEPDIFPHVPARVSLTLAGHTHGGQVRVPLLWPHFVPSRYGARFAYGHIVEDARHLVVSGGLGTSFMPLRLGVMPEIVHVRLG